MALAFTIETSKTVYGLFRIVSFERPNLDLAHSIYKMPIFQFIMLYSMIFPKYSTTVHIHNRFNLLELYLENFFMKANKSALDFGMHRRIFASFLSIHSLYTDQLSYKRKQSILIR